MITTKQSKIKNIYTLLKVNYTNDRLNLKIILIECSNK